MSLASGNSNILQGSPGHAKQDERVLSAGIHRQCLFGGLRIGMYEPVKTFYMGSNPGEAPFLTKVTLLLVPTEMSRWYIRQRWFVAPLYQGQGE